MSSLRRSGVSIKITLLERKLYFYQGGTLKNVYPVAIGKPSTPSPIGNWHIAKKSILKGNTVFGSRWLGLNKSGYGIHGTNNPSSIGKSVSLGCIRMYNHDVEAIFSIVSIGTPVEIVSGSTSVFPSEPISQGTLYTIKKGDTMWNIANRFNITLQTLIKLNPNINPDMLIPGQQIRIF